MANMTEIVATPGVKIIKDLIVQIREADHAYYMKDSPIMSDKQYDELYDTLVRKEQETGIVFANSPTQTVGGGVIDSLVEVTHSRPMLSADKTKSHADILKFCLLAKESPWKRISIAASWKLDGLTIVLKYEGGKLIQAVTRGGGITGEDVTHAVKAFTNVPLTIPYKGSVEVRGEGVVSWENFNAINEALDGGESYAHPRGLAAGSVRQFDPKKVAERNLEFLGFEVFDPNFASKLEQFAFMQRNGIATVPYEILDINTIEDVDYIVAKFNPEKFPYAVDGQIFEFNDIEFGKSLGATGHHERCKMALKWEDETYKTIFRSIDFQTTRTGMISMTALFDPVMIGGAKITRATLHNLTIAQKLELGTGDELEVYKANMIIPAIHDNCTRSNTYQFPTVCPCCGATLVEEMRELATILRCTNINCSARKVRQFTHFVSKPAANIDGLSSSMLEKLLQHGFIQAFGDLYRLKEHQDKIASLEGSGTRSVEKLLMAIEKSRSMPLANFLVSFGIPQVGKTASKQIAKKFLTIEAVEEALDQGFDFTTLEDFGETMAANLRIFWSNAEQRALWSDLRSELNIQSVAAAAPIKTSAFTGKTIVITGTLSQSRETFANRLTAMGAKVSSSISRNTHFLLAGENAGSKLEKAKNLGVTVLSEADFEKLVS